MDNRARGTSIIHALMETIHELPSRTPDRDDCAKRLFGDVGDTANTSEYFSQSSEENGGGSTQPFSSPDPVQVSDILY